MAFRVREFAFENEQGDRIPSVDLLEAFAGGELTVVERADDGASLAIKWRNSGKRCERVDDGDGRSRDNYIPDGGGEKRDDDSHRDLVYEESGRRPDIGESYAIYRSLVDGEAEVVERDDDGNTLVIELSGGRRLIPEDRYVD